MILQTLLAVMASQYLNVPYKWGGNSYDGLDCSGLVIKTLRDVGQKVPDMSAQSIYHWAKDRPSSQSCEPGEDCLLFFGRYDTSISHVAIALSGGKYMIEAGGAGRESRTMSAQDLARVDARVRIKPISNRRDLIASIKIKY